MDGSRASVRRRYRSDLRVGITANDLCDLRLSAIGRFLTDKEYDMILFQSVNTSQVDELIEVLLKTENGYFDSFFAVLENHSCNRMGKRLKEEGNVVGPTVHIRSDRQRTQHAGHTPAVTAFMASSNLLETYKNVFLNIVKVLKLQNGQATHTQSANDDYMKTYGHGHLPRNATAAFVGELCDVANDSVGYPKMKELGREMKKALPIGGKDGLDDQVAEAKAKVTNADKCGPDDTEEEAKARASTVVLALGIRSQPMDTVKKALVHIDANVPKFCERTGFSAELQVSHEETKVVLMTSNHIFPSLPITESLSIFFRQVSDISPGIMIQKKELFDGYCLMENGKYVPGRDSISVYNAVAEELDVMRDHLQDEVPKLLLVAHSAEFMKKKGLHFVYSEWILIGPYHGVMSISFEVWHAAVGLFVASILLILIFRSVMKGSPLPLLGPLHGGEKMCMAKNTGKKNQRDDLSGIPAGRTEILITLAVIAMCKGKNKCRYSSGTNLVGPVQGQLACTKLSALFVILLLLLRSGDVETNPGPLERGEEETDNPDEKPKPQFVIITANGTVQNVVKRYLKLGDHGRVCKQLSAYEWDKDPFLKKKNVEVTANDPVDIYDVFTIGEVMGVHVKCSRYGPRGAQDTTSDLLKKASDEKWPLKVIFVVGCCGASMSDAKKTQKNWRGTVLLSEQMEDYLDAGKAEEGGLLLKPRTYTLCGTWVSRLSEESICQPDVEEESQRDIPVEVVGKYLSGSLVIKTADLANRCRGEMCQMAGIEMEGSGVYSTVDRSALKDMTKVAVVKGISDYAGSDKNEQAKSVVFGKETAEEIDDKARQEIATLHAITLVTRCVASNARGVFYVPSEFDSVEEAIKREGKVSVEVSKLVFLGPPEAGKTQLKCAFMQQFEKVEESTPASAGAVQMVQMYVDDGSLIPFTPEMLKEGLLKESQNKCAEDKISKDSNDSSQPPSSLPQNVQTDDPEQAEGSDKPQITDTETVGTSSAENDHSPEEEKGQSQVDLSSTEFNRLYDAVKELAPASAITTKGLSLHYVHLMDNGGQPAFFALHPMIATSRATYLLVYDMEKGLNKEDKYTYRKKKGESPLVMGTYTNLDVIQRCLLTIENLQGKFQHVESVVKPQDGNASIECSVLVVGTRDDTNPPVRDQDKELETAFRSYPAWKNGVLPRENNMKLFPVSACSKDCLGVKEVQQRATSKDFRLTMDIPISWFHCYLLFWYAKVERIHKSKKEKEEGRLEQAPSQLEVLPYESFFKVCKKIIPREDHILDMVQAFHYLGLFFFPALNQAKPGWKPNKDEPVFTNPDLLYGELTKVLEFSFTEAFPYPHSNSPKKLNQLKHFGELTPAIMECLGIPDHLGLLPKFRIWLLEQLSTWGLAAELPKSDQDNNDDPVYFVPCVLQPFQEQDDNPNTDCQPNLLASALCISLTICDKYCTYYIPNGAFTHFIVNLLNTFKYERVTRNEKQSIFSDYVILMRKCDSKDFGCTALTWIKHKYKLTVRDVNTQCIRIAIQCTLRGVECDWNDVRQIILDELKPNLEEACNRMYCKQGSNQFEMVVASDCTCTAYSKQHLAKLDIDRGVLTCMWDATMESLVETMEPALAMVVQTHQAMQDSQHDDVLSQPITGTALAPTPAAGTQKQAVGALPFSASKFLEPYEDEFLDVVDAKQNLLKLKHKKVISANVKTKIEGETEEDAKYILLEHLQKNATLGTLRVYCDVAIAADGYARMQELGKKMKAALPAEDTEEADADGADTKDRPPAKKHKPDHSEKDEPPMPVDGRPPPHESPNGSPAAVLSDRVYEHKNHLVLLRQHVSRNAPRKGRALLEALGLTAPQIEGYYSNHPQNEEEAVQAGLQGWVGERDPTWGDLLKAMKSAGIALQHRNELKIALSTNK